MIRDIGKKKLLPAFFDEQENEEIVRMLNVQLHHPTTKCYRILVKVKNEDRKTFSVANAFILDGIDVRGYKTALIARLISNIFPAGIFTLLVGHSIDPLIAGVKVDMGMTQDVNVDALDIKVIANAPEHWRTDEIKMLYTTASSIPYSRLIIRPEA